MVDRTTARDRALCSKGARSQWEYRPARSRTAACAHDRNDHVKLKDGVAPCSWWLGQDESAPDHSEAVVHPRCLCQRTAIPAANKPNEEADFQMVPCEYAWLVCRQFPDRRHTLRRNAAEQAFEEGGGEEGVAGVRWRSGACSVAGLPALTDPRFASARASRAKGMVIGKRLQRFYPGIAADLLRQ